jgi:hypothetical protein
MTPTWKIAALMIAALALTSCSGAGYQNGFPADNSSGFDSAGMDTNWIGAGLLLALLAAFTFN